MRKSRVLVAAAGLFLAFALLWLRVVWLSTVMHATFTERAERNQEQRVLVKPARGDLMDRRGRPLARDLMTYSVSAVPAEMTNVRACAHALALLLDRDAAALERQFAAHHRFSYVARQLSPELGQRIADANLRGVHLSIETRREYTLAAAASEIIGRTDVDNLGVDGIELQLDDVLRGRPGWMTLFRDGRGRALALPRGLRRRPENGADVVLSLDSDLQSIVEHHLACAVDTLRAVRGFAIFIDPRTGEVLASANVPHLGPGKARNWNFTDQYEPGSTFKAVVAGAALEEGLARPDQVFEASATGMCQIVPGAVFHDVHKEAAYTFRDAVRWSSNIVMGKLGLLVGPERLYRYATALGFGSLTGVSFPGETAGRLRSPATWSARSAPTIAIGHEVTVTPLQLALAYAAIANGGVLMQPMLVREVRPASGLARSFSPEASRRVFSEATTRTLREMLEAVVDSGTAKAARVPGLRIGGKTGTAQKYDASIGTYGKGMYLSSFVGFAPADAPTLVGVVVIDEPHSGHYYGGEVAAPVFREVVKDLQRLPSGPFAPGVSAIALRPPAPAPVTVPDLRLLPPALAQRRLAEFGLRGLERGAGARVLAQSPAAGEAAERGAPVVLWLEAPDDSTSGRTPELVGLALREALRRLTLCQTAARIEGAGVVVRQEPVAGAPLPRGREMRLWCEPRPADPAVGPGVPAMGVSASGSAP
jgi:cell division protein FtsI/penicillin-binding protein 2